MRQMCVGENLRRHFVNWSSSAIEDTIVIAGAPRSGTTWLLELLRTLPEYKALNEPLFLHNSPGARAAGFAWRTHITPGERNEGARRFFERSLSGRIAHRPLWHYTASSTIRCAAEHIRKRKLIVKFCRAGRLLHWMTQEFNLRGVVLIIRHPCAVIASQLAHGGWNDESFSSPSDGHSFQVPKELQDKFGSVLASIKTKLDEMVAIWCLDYYIPLIHYAPQGYPWVLVPYERLVTRRTEEVSRILNSLGATATESISEQLNEASKSASESLEVRSPQQQLEKWKTQLSDAEIDRVLELVAAFEIDFYSRDTEPDYDRLNKMQLKSCIW